MPKKIPHNVDGAINFVLLANNLDSCRLIPRLSPHPDKRGEPGNVAKAAPLAICIYGII